MTEQPHDDKEATSEGLIERLLRPGRQEELDPFTIMTFMPIEPDHQVADIGCGPGYFSIPMAKYLVFGKLYALDVSDEMLDALRQRVSEARLGNVEVLKCGETDFPLPRESLDGAFLAFVVHYSEEHESRIAFLQAVRDMLKPRGWCTILEFYKQDTESGPHSRHRIGPEELEGLAREAGFESRWWRDINGTHYMALMRKGG
jgi:ubiquinone/menaquinone biosynthesis C-methylase UbiE